MAYPWFSQKIQRLHSKVAKFCHAIKHRVSRGYASRIRQRYRPHSRLWQALAVLAGISGECLIICPLRSVLMVQFKSDFAANAFKQSVPT